MHLVRLKGFFLFDTIATKVKQLAILINELKRFICTVFVLDAFESHSRCSIVLYIKLIKPFKEYLYNREINMKTREKANISCLFSAGREQL